MSGREWLDQVDDSDRVVGRVRRPDMRKGNVLHRTVAILCQNSDGLIYVQQRTQTKDLFPGLYDVFVSGCVDAGETYDTAAIREIAEELGIEGPTPQLLSKHRYDGPLTRHLTQLYRVCWDGPIVHQASEVQWGKFCNVEEIRAASWPLVPDGAEMWQHYLAQLP